MNLKKGEIYKCNEPYCGAELEVVRAANAACHGKFMLRCCCGKEIALKQAVEHKELAAAGATAGTRK